MLQFRPILLVNGILLTVLAAGMIIPAMVDLAVDNNDWINFVICAFITAFFGIMLILTNQGDEANLTTKQAFILTVITWVTLAAFAALPFMFSELNLSYTDAFFESMSGLTTTGATILIGLDAMPPGILMWRAILQWMGGIGIIVVAIAILPMLRIGGMQLFRTESSDQSAKVLPRAAQIAFAIGGVYIFLTLFCAILLWTAGMSEFDAICHAMTTIATAGFSTHDQSIGFFDNAIIEYIITIFMIASGIPFVLYVQMLGGNKHAIWKDAQVQWFVSLLFFAVLVMIFWLHYRTGYDIASSIRYAIFNVTSVMTTTGFTSDNYAIWGGFAVTTIFLLSVVGGCTGSTTGGIKIFRFQVLYQTAKVQINQLIHPHAIFRIRFNHKPLSENVTSSVMSFIILFAFSFLVLAVTLSLFGLDYVSSMSAAAATLANLGPALGSVVGPNGTYITIPDVAKWILTFAMLLGRLEIFTILVLFSSHFWRD